MDRSPLEKSRQPKQTRKPVPVMADDQLVALFQACDGKDVRSRRDTALIRLYLDTGARLFEIVGMRLDDLDLSLDVIRVRGKGDKHRAIPFGARTGQALSRYLRARSKHLNGHGTDALWITERGNRTLTVSAVKTMFQRRGVETGLMRLMGWSSRDMLRIYAASAADDRAHAAHRRLALADRL